MFSLRIRVPRAVTIRTERGTETFDRERFFEWVWQQFASEGLEGVHEGTFLADAWTVDAAEAPRDRDWVAELETVEAELYFGTLEQGEAARSELLASVPALGVPGELEEQVPRDWDAEWKASFLASPSGVQIPPYWRVVPPWLERSPPEPPTQSRERTLRINPGAGFGTGTHETTQLCLSELARVHDRIGLAGERVLDFGSGSGILAIGAALLGAEVDAVEVDELAIDNARENLALNGVTKVRLAGALGASHRDYAVVVANILKPVLLEFADELVGRLRGAPSPVVVLSGLIAPDVVPVLERFDQALAAAGFRGLRPEIRELGEWRLLSWESAKESER